MYIRKSNGKRTVTLEDGTVLSQADLPPRSVRRWVASRKAVVVRAVDNGLISEEEALERWSLSDEELQQWRDALCRHGEAALKVTKAQRYRQP